MTGTVREYLYAGGEAPTAMRARQADGSYKSFFFQTNTHGDVVAVTDRDGNIVNRYVYGPWGEATRVSEQVHQPFRYAGYRYEDGFDLYYLRARWMDPNTGRFLTRDPIPGALQNLVALNQYIYVKNSPATRTDPSGYGPRKPTVIAYLHGISAPARGTSDWVDLLQEEFPNSDVFAPDYGIGPINVITGTDDSQVRRISNELRSRVAGRRLEALAHSWGGVLLFKALDDAPAFVSLAITMGSPVYTRGYGAVTGVGWWVAMCGDLDRHCRPDDLERAHRENARGPDEVIIPGGINHSGYQSSDLVKKYIFAKLRQYGAQ